MSRYYIARDKDESLYLYSEKPLKDNDDDYGFWTCTNSTNVCELINDDFFQEVKWEDKEPKVLTIEESPWIKVEDRLPDDKELVFVLYKHKETNELSYGTNSLLNGKWVVNSNSWELIAWMLIPEFKERLNELNNKKGYEQW